MIHPSAIVHPDARIGADTEIGPFAVIDQEVEIGPRCRIGPYVYITGRTAVGERNRFHAGCVIGDEPQDLRYKGEETGVVIGPGNVFREQVTVHRSNRADEPTTIGSNNLLMANSHVGHNARIGNHVIIANGALIAGHVTVFDRVFISGNCMVHQFVRIGTLALMQGGSGISKDLPPYTIARGDNRIAGLNVIGMRRAGITAEDRLDVKRLYHLLFRAPGKFRERLASAGGAAQSEAGRQLVQFLCTGSRGFCADRGHRAEAHE